MIHSNAQFRSRCLRSVAAAAALVLVAGCAGSGGAVREKTSREWYDEGSQLAGKKKYDEAVDAFREAAKGYRGAELDADIQLALADAYFEKEDFAAAVEAYAGFLRLHPHSARADYAQLRVGTSWLRQMRSADRSPDEAHKAAEAFEALLRGYPRSSHLEEARAGLTQARRRAAEHELTVGDFYKRTGSWRAAAGRYETVLRSYGDTGLADRALYERGRCLQRLNEAEEAGRLFDQLRREHPQSGFVEALDKDRS